MEFLLLRLLSASVVCDTLAIVHWTTKASRLLKPPVAVPNRTSCRPTGQKGPDVHFLGAGLSVRKHTQRQPNAEWTKMAILFRTGIQDLFQRDPARYFRSTVGGPWECWAGFVDFLRLAPSDYFHRWLILTLPIMRTSGLLFHFSTCVLFWSPDC